MLADQNQQKEIKKNQINSELLGFNSQSNENKENGAQTDQNSKNFVKSSE